MTKSLSGYEHADSVINELQTSKQHEKQKERQIRSARNIDPPNFRPLLKRKYSSGKLSALNNNDIDDDIDINGISPSSSTNNNRRREETTFQFKQNDHPDDESSTFIRAKTFILVRYIKQFILPCYSRIRHIYYRIEHFIRNRIDIKKIGLVILVGLVFVFMKVGLENETYPSSSGDYQSTSLYNRGSNSIQQQQTTYITGYQASSQVPIPVEYSNFVELGEFVNAVTLIRMHREQQMQQQKQNENGGRIRHRRLEEDDDKEGDKKEGKEEGKKEDGKDETENAKEEDDAEDKAADHDSNNEDSKSKEDSADELDNVVDKAWEKTIQKNPEMEKQQQKANLLKVHHVPFFWHSEYISFVLCIDCILFSLSGNSNSNHTAILFFLTDIIQY